jgi:hypothetical protein
MAEGLNQVSREVLAAFGTGKIKEEGGDHKQ